MILPGESRIDVVLAPGELRFGGSRLLLRTLLGSCVSVTVWHPHRRIGGMCHYLLPSRGPGDPGGGVPDGRYADEALQLMLRIISGRGTAPQEYQVKAFGGGVQFASPGGPPGPGVPERNVEAALALFPVHGLTPTVTDLGGTGPRTIVLDVATGDVWVRRGLLTPPRGEG